MNEKVTVEEMTVDGRGPPQSPQYKSTVAAPLQPIWFLKGACHVPPHILPPTNARTGTAPESMGGRGGTGGKSGPHFSA